jgi:hypothetical protein
LVERVAKLVLTSGAHRPLLHFAVQTPSPELVCITEKIYAETGDARFLVPVVQGLTKPRIVELLPNIFALKDRQSISHTIQSVHILFLACS